MIPSHPNLANPTLPWYEIQCGNNSRESYKTMLRIQGIELALSRTNSPHFRSFYKCRVVNELTRYVIYSRKHPDYAVK